MKVVVAIDSLKGSLSSLEAGLAIKEGIMKVDKNVDVVVKPIADGGEGTVAALVAGMNGKLQEVVVKGPLNQDVKASYGIIASKKLAIMEMASVAGLTLVPESQRNPLYTTTYGLGQMIKDAINRGCRHFIIGIGGSATNDGGIGMLQALGFDFYDKDGKPVALGAIGLKDLVMIDDQNVITQLKDCQFQIACDVENVLCGINGCSEIYGYQKGASTKTVKLMDQWLNNYANICKVKYPDSDANYPGTGAAGGLGFAFLTFTNALLQPGIEIVLDTINLKTEIENCDLVITGEGCLDRQTAMGKAPIGIAKIAKQFNKPVIALAGSLSKDAYLCNHSGIDAYFSIIRSVISLKEAMAKEIARNNMIDTMEQIFRLIKLGDLLK